MNNMTHNINLERGALRVLFKAWLELAESAMSSAQKCEHFFHYKSRIETLKDVIQAFED